MRKTKQEKLIEYEIVKRASEGDVDAINLIFAHYESYIRKLSLRPYTDEFGMTQFFVDYELKNRLEAKLLEKILDFEAVQFFQRSRNINYKLRRSHFIRNGFFYVIQKNYFFLKNSIFLNFCRDIICEVNSQGYLKTEYATCRQH